MPGRFVVQAPRVEPMIRIPKRLQRPAVAYAHDLIAAALSFTISLYLRVGGDIVDYSLEFILLATALFTVIAGVVFWRLDIHRGIWRYASLNDLTVIARASAWTNLLFLLAMYAVARLGEMPRSIVFINWFVLMILLAAPRILYRRLKDGRISFTFESRPDRRVPVLLAGAGDAADMFLQSIERPGVSGDNYRVVGLLDDSPSRIGRFIRGVEVLGVLNELPDVVARMKELGVRPQRVVVTRESITGPALGRLVDAAGQLGLSVSRLPRLTEFRATEAKTGLTVRPVAIEDLLERPRAVLDRASIEAFVRGKRVLVTGAGGTIGSELARQIAALQPAHLALLDNSEFNLYSIDLELGEKYAAVPRNALLADVRDARRVAALFAEQRPNVVFHAAALKHVPMVESHPCEGMLTNVIGTRAVAVASRAAGAEAMVLISTDKAVNPSSVMGASKRLAESWCQALDLEERSRGGRTRFVTVRFGNVLGSTGSVVPLFERQLRTGGPLTVTHPDITRYFMTVGEAVELVLQASVMGVGQTDDSSAGHIHVLDMGEPIRIADLARRMIKLAGLPPGKSVEIVFTGLRPGEKLAEELFHEAEPLRPTAMNSILLASPRVGDRALLARALDELATLAAAGNVEAVFGVVRRLVPEFQGGAEATAVDPGRAQRGA